MFETQSAEAIYRKLAAAPVGWLRSKEGRAIQGRALRMIRTASGTDARHLRQLLIIAATLDTLTGA